MTTHRALGPASPFLGTQPGLWEKLTFVHKFPQIVFIKSLIAQLVKTKRRTQFLKKNLREKSTHQT